MVLDAYSRRVVGWAMADHLRTELALDALTLARQRRRRGRAGLVQHTDHGCPSTAGAYQTARAAAGLVCSMSRAGNCYDHALAESCFATLKTELLPAQPFPTRRAARLAVFACIEVFSNRHRRHSALGQLAPVTFESQFANKQAA